VLKFFNNKKNELEKSEDIEILRLIENSIDIKMVKLSNTSFSIDLKSDIEKLKKMKFI
jgi:CMP-2-keto-3-deoxyoctulosonic acid synthetase